MEKYLGNKRVLLKCIHDFVKKNCVDSKSICDIFSGTTNTGRFFNNKGYQVFSNDINRFSYIIGRCYFGFNTYPTFSNLRLPHQLIPEEDIKIYFNRLLKKDNGLILNKFNLEEFLKINSNALNVINYLNKIQDYRRPQNEYIKEHYTIFGSKSYYKSVRGTEGKRNYFSEENVKKLDLILDQIREWYQCDSINDDEVCLLLTSVIEEVVLVANVNGTFHDFNRDKLWPNSLQKLTLKLPLYELGNNSIIYCNDAVKIINEIPEHDILYIDPPYNFRQYSSYYHFINFISAFPFLENIDDYLSKIEFVRGQNMLDDFTSDFCFQEKFISTLKKLIMNSKSKYVIMSYYGGRNHWNHWSKDEVATDIGFQKISSMFNDSEIFKKHLAESLFRKRQNYQSRVGEKKEHIDEYLFFGIRQTMKNNKYYVNEIKNGNNILSIPNKNLGLEYFSNPIVKDINLMEAVS
jgi:adenine-specific DNA-methyltransferase